jgi:YbbR domain-containing protein
MPKQNNQPSNVRKYFIWLAMSLCAGGAILYALNVLPVNRIEEREISAQLVLSGLPENLTTAPPAEKFVGARVKGPANLLDALATNQLTCTLDLAGLGPGLTYIPLTAKNFGLAETLRVTAIKPETITLRIKTADRKKLPVYIAIAGKPAAGFKVIDFFALPGHVTVAGPQNLLAGMDRLMTKPIAIEGIAESIKKETALDLPAGVTTPGIEKAIIADIRIAAKTDRRTFSRIRVIARGAGRTAVFSPPEIALEIEGPADTLAKLDQTRDITAYVDLASLKPGVYVKRASITLPVGITLVKAEPELFTVTVTERKP